MTLPAELRDREPMLAQPSSKIGSDVHRATALLAERGWVFDYKWDGVRALALLEQGHVRLRSRSGEDLTRSFPEVAQQLERLGLPGAVVLDGELVCFDGARPSFQRTHRRAMQHDPRRAARLAAEQPATFVLFDLPWCADDLRRMPWTERHARLEQLAAEHGLIVSPTGDNGPAMLRTAQQQDLEGLVAKRPTSAYRHGHSPDWLKLKFVRSLSAIVAGVTPGQGARQSSFGALLVELRTPEGRPWPLGKVGSGLRAHHVSDIAARLRAGEPVVVEVTYQGLTSSGQLRFPRFTGLRTDLPPDACTTAQLGH